MKKLLVLTSALLALTAAVASAQIDLAWNNCITIVNQAANKNYACDGSLDGVPQKVVPSFICPAVGLTKFVGVSMILDLASSDGGSPTPTLPDYWKMGVGECRDGVLVFPAGLTAIGNTTTCKNPWTGHTGGGFQVTSNSPYPIRSHIQLAFATDAEIVLTAGQEYIAGVMTIDPFKDIDLGGGVCNGCALPMCLVVNEIDLFQTAGTPPQDIFNLSAANTRQYITWQGGAVPSPAPGVVPAGCPGATPTKNSTWGSVKALYR